MGLLIQPALLFVLLFLPANRCLLVEAFTTSSSSASLHLLRLVPLRVEQQDDSSNEAGWSPLLVPSSYQQAATLAEQSLVQALSAPTSSTQARLSLDLLLPGLNQKLEQKAILRTEILFKFVSSLMAPLARQYDDCVFAFQSIGEGAAFQKYCFQTNQQVPPSILLSDVGLNRVLETCGCILLIIARNNVGDNVLRAIMEIAAKRPSTTLIFLNCDLSDRVAPGIMERKERDAFRNSIRPVFYMRNIVALSRPSLTPIEKGALLYTQRSGWQILAVQSNEIFGPGSLNRFCDQAVFEKDVCDPTSANPPSFLLVGSFYETRPTRADIDTAMSKAELLAGQLTRRDETRRMERGIGGNSIVDEQTSRQLIITLLNGGSEKIEAAGRRLLLDAVNFVVSRERERRRSLSIARKMGVVERENSVAKIDLFSSQQNAVSMVGSDAPTGAPTSSLDLSQEYHDTLSGRWRLCASVSEDESDYSAKVDLQRSTSLLTTEWEFFPTNPENGRFEVTRSIKAFGGSLNIFTSTASASFDGSADGPLTLDFSSTRVELQVFVISDDTICLFTRAPEEFSLLKRIPM